MAKKYKNISVISTGSWVPEHLDNNTVDQKYNVIIKNLIVDASIGIHEHEKIKKQRVSISLSIEVIDNKVEGNDQFWGLAWKTKDVRKKREYLVENGFDVSDVKDGRKKDTLVATVKFDEIKIPTLLVEHLK